MTAFVKRNSTESVGLIETEADASLTEWTLDLAKEYISIPAEVYKLPGYVSSWFQTAVCID